MSQRRWRCGDCGLPNTWEALECQRCRMISPPDKERWEVKQIARSPIETLQPVSPMTDPDHSLTLRRMAEEFAKGTRLHSGVTGESAYEFAYAVASAVEEAIAADPDRYKSFRKRVLVQAEAAVRQELEPYLQHLPDCGLQVNANRTARYPYPCTCGLDLLRQGEKKEEEARRAKWAYGSGPGTLAGNEDL